MTSRHSTDQQHQQSADDPSGLSLWQKLVLFSVAFYICAELSRFFSAHNSSYLSFWLPAGLSVAVLLLNKTRDWPWLMLVTLPANLAFDLRQGTPFVTVLFFYCANTLEAVTGAWLVRRFVAPKPTLGSLKEFFGLMFFSAAVSTVAGATVGATTLILSGMSQSFWESWQTWWWGEALAIFLVSPFVLIWFSKPVFKLLNVNQPRRLIEAALLVVGLTVLTWHVFAMDEDVATYYNDRLRLLPFILWAGLRFGSRGAAAANLWLALLAAFLTTRFLQDRSAAQIAAGDYIANLQSFLAISTFVGLIPAIIVGERDQKVSELRGSEERFRNLTKASFEGVCITENGRILDVNDQALKMLGYTRDEVAGREIIDCITPETRALAAEMIRSAKEGASEHRLIRKDGSIFYVETRAKMVQLGNRTVRMSSVRDITEFKLAKQALADSEALLRQLIEQAPASVAMFDTEMRYLQASSRWLKHHHYKEESIIGRLHYELFPNVPERWKEAHKRVLAGAIERYDRDTLIRPDGTTEWVQWEAQPWRKTDGTIGGIIISAQIITERIRMEEDLRLSEERFRAAMQHSPIGMGLVAPDGRWLDVNPALCKIIGYSQTELLTIDFQTITHPDDLNTDMDLVRQMLSRQIESYELVKRYLHKDGHAVWIQLNVSLVWNPDGSPRYFVSQVQDITERKRSEEALRQSEKLIREQYLELENFYRMTPVGLCLVDRDLRYVRINERLAAINGYPVDAHIGRKIEEMVPEISHQTALIYRHVIESGEPAFNIEVRGATPAKPDDQRDWLINYHPLKNADGFVYGVCGMVMDITERKRAEVILQENQAKLLLSMDMAKLAHWEYDVASDRFTVDEHFFKYYNTTSAEQGGVSMSASDYIRRFVHPEDAVVIAREIANGLATTDPHYTRQIEQRIIRADGSTGVMLTRFSIIKDAAGHTIKGYGINQDITEQKQAEQQQKKLEEQLRQSQKLEALGTLAGGTAHEFNNMLGIILGYSELIKSELGEHHPVQPDLDEVLKAGQRAKEVIQQVLTFSRQQRQKREQVQLTIVVREALKLIRATLPASVAIHTDIADDDPSILGNPTQIHQVLMNICINAWHALEADGGTIRVTQKTVTLGRNAAEIHANLREGTYAHLSIADNGAGMDAATLTRIFEPFFTTKGPGKGSGLGLAVVHGIMQSHEGAVVAQSEPGKGSTFHLYFPAQPTAAEKPVAAVSKSLVPRGNSRHILVVDDEPSLTHVATKFLQRLGYRTTGVYSATEALAALQQSVSFDLVITDLTMPGMSGIELARTLHERQPRLPVILVSGFEGAKAASDDGTPNIRALLQKPFSPDTLARTIQSVLAGEPVAEPLPV